MRIVSEVLINVRKPSCKTSVLKDFNTLRTELFKLFKRPFPGFLTILTL